MIVADYIDVISIPTPVGGLIAGATAKGICVLEFEDTERLDEHICSVFRGKHCEIRNQTDLFLDTLKVQLDSYFAGQLRNFDIVLHIHGTSFQLKIWNEIRSIAYGNTISYRQLCERIGPSGSPRAAASATALNRIMIVIPCHRVIGIKGSLTGYRGGMKRKKWLLEWERENTGTKKQLRLKF